MKIKVEIEIDDSMVSTKHDLANLIRKVGACIDQGLMSGDILNEKNGNESNKWEVSLSKN